MVLMVVWVVPFVNAVVNDSELELVGAVDIVGGMDAGDKQAVAKQVL